jgi:uncharacterized protein YoxC
MKKIYKVSGFIGTAIVVITLVILSVNYVKLKNRLSESQINLKNTITSMSNEINSYDSYSTYLENFIKQNIPNTVWTVNK